MVANQSCDGRRLGVVTVILVLAAFVPGAVGQARGVPASVTSIGFGGNFTSPPGIPASVTSIGPNGLPGNFFLNSPIVTAPVHGAGTLFPPQQNHHHHGFFPWGIPVVAVPYAYPVEIPVAVMDEQEAEPYNGGPTIFDRRGPGPSNHQDEVRYTPREENREAEPQPQNTQQSAEEPVRSQPSTTVVFKDGHAIDVSNYAIVGETLFDLTPGHPRKIALTDIDVEATAKQNEDRGVDFTVPVTQ
ncbi:MAG TPA: hypothetical protein VH437_01990 [Terriglobales bacterium]|jgi:hypothetical protein